MKFLNPRPLLAVPCVLGLLAGACRSVEPESPRSPDGPGPLQSQAEISRDPGPSLADLVAGLSDSGNESLALNGAYPRQSSTVSSSRQVSAGPRLSSTRVTGLRVEDEESLRAVVDQVRLMTGLPLVVTQQAEQAVLDAGIVYDLDLEHPMRARQLFDLIVELSRDEIDWTVRHGAVIFTTPKDARGKLVTYMHDIRAAIRPRTDFHGPKVGYLGLGAENGSGEEDPFGGATVSPSRLDPDRLVETIQNTIAPKTWEDEGVSIEVTESGLLLVRHTSEVQVQVARFVAQLGV